MDAEAKKEIDALKAALKAQNDGQAAIIAQAVAQAVAAAIAARPMSDLEAARAAEVAEMRATVAGIKAKALEIAKTENPSPTLLKYVVGNVVHYRDGVLYQQGDIIALPNDDAVKSNPSRTWSAYDPKAGRAPNPAELAETRALSQIAKEQATKATGPLAPAKKVARPSDTEV